MDKKALKAKVDHFDISDLKWHVEPTGVPNELRFTIKSKKRFNNLRIWLALSAMRERFGAAIGVEEEDEENPQ